jgi:hypothetical protein
MMNGIGDRIYGLVTMLLVIELSESAWVGCERFRVEQPVEGVYVLSAR